LIALRILWSAGFISALAACDNPADSQGQSTADQKIATAEVLIDAFYSFNSDVLLNELVSAQESVPEILFYQGWAEGGNYEVVERKPCVPDNQNEISCSITVKDDLIGALGIDFNVTDTFHLTFAEDKIVAVTTSSNDPKAYNDAEDWVRKNQPEVFEGPCREFFEGGPTPGDCVRAIVKGYSEYAASGRVSDSPDSP
jgi:hypothetical protein